MERIASILFHFENFKQKSKIYIGDKIELFNVNDIHAINHAIMFIKIMFSGDNNYNVYLNLLKNNDIKLHGQDVDDFYDIILEFLEFVKSLE